MINRKGELTIKEILKPTERKSCSFERIYFSRGSDADIYKERKELGKLIMPTILKELNYDINNSVFSYIPNTAETSFYGMVESVDNYLINKKTKEILNNKNISKEKIIEDIVPKSLNIQLYKAVLDSNAGEHGARMTAMHKATDNAGDMLFDLKLTYNKARQASITNEILEIVGGAEALNS